MSDSQETAVAVRDGGGLPPVSDRQIALMRQVLGINQPTSWCSFAPQSEREIQQAAKAFAQADGNLCDMADKTIAVENIVIHHAQVRDQQTQELLSMVRLVLLAPDGKCYASVASVPLNSLTHLLGIPGIGMPPYDPPVMIRLAPVKLKVGKTVTLEYRGRMAAAEWQALKKKRGE